VEAAADSGTRLSLLRRLRDETHNQQAWNEFVDHYGPRIYDWCLRWNLQEADAQDVTQNVLLKLAKRLREFQYDPSRSFRAWLKTVTHHAWYDFLEANRRLSSSQDSAVLATLEARQDLEHRLGELFDQELLAEAMRRARQRVAPQTWEAFRLTTLEGLSGADAAERIPMAVSQVFVAKRRVQKIIQDEIRRLQANDENEDHEDPLPQPERTRSSAGRPG
jgi:RNA polymerase sigma-70 factor (ECF subfamily)